MSVNASVNVRESQEASDAKMRGRRVQGAWEISLSSGLEGPDEEVEIAE